MGVLSAGQVGLQPARDPSFPWGRGWVHKSRGWWGLTPFPGTETKSRLRNPQLGGLDSHAACRNLPPLRSVPRRQPAPRHVHLKGPAVKFWGVVAAEPSFPGAPCLLFGQCVPETGSRLLGGRRVRTQSLGSKSGAHRMGVAFRVKVWDSSFIHSLSQHFSGLLGGGSSCAERATWGLYPGLPGNPTCRLSLFCGRPGRSPSGQKGPCSPSWHLGGSRPTPRQPGL